MSSTRRQRTDGHLAGSWDADTVWGGYGGRIYSTAMATLCLEVYYRYLPLTTNPNLSRTYGTRHRAAIGISEESDAV